MKVGNILKTMSELTQYVPFVSVPMSLVNIFVKAVLSTQKGEPKNDYLKFVAKKSWGETLATPIPFVGGVVCCIARMAKDETSTIAKSAPVKKASGSPKKGTTS